MGKQKSEEKHFLNLAGEYGVCSELAKRKITASITYGNHKAADIIVMKTEGKEKKALTIEVKTTPTNRIVTGFFQKYKTPDISGPDIWVIVHIGGNSQSTYYVMTHKEVSEAQMKRNNMQSWHEVNGVDNLLIKDIEFYKDRWDII